MIPLTHDEQVYHEKRKHCHICRRKFCNNENDKKKFKLYHKVRDHCHYTGSYSGAAHSICNLRYKIQREIPVVIHNGSTYDYHFIINELAKQFKDNIDCLAENTEKYIAFKVPLKIINENGKPIIYKLKFIDSYIIDLWQHHCRIVQITYQKPIKKNVNHVRKEKKSQ